MRVKKNYINDSYIARQAPLPPKRQAKKQKMSQIDAERDVAQVDVVDCASTFFSCYCSCVRARFNNVFVVALGFFSFLLSEKLLLLFGK